MRLGEDADRRRGTAGAAEADRRGGEVVAERVDEVEELRRALVLGCASSVLGRRPRCSARPSCSPVPAAVSTVCQRLVPVETSSSRARRRAASRARGRSGRGPRDVRPLSVVAPARQPAGQRHVGLVAVARVRREHLGRWRTVDAVRAAARPPGPRRRRSRRRPRSGHRREHAPAEPVAVAVPVEDERRPCRRGERRPPLGAAPRGADAAARRAPVTRREGAPRADRRLDDAAQVRRGRARSR